MKLNGLGMYKLETKEKFLAVGKACSKTKTVKNKREIISTETLLSTQQHGCYLSSNAWLVSWPERNTGEHAYHTLL